RCERQHTGSAQLTGARHIPHVADAAEHQRIEIVAFHAGQDFCASFGTQPGEVDPCVVFETHHADEHPGVACDGTHASPPARSGPRSSLAAILTRGRLRVLMPRLRTVRTLTR